MTPREAIDRMVGRIRLKHFALSTERAYVGWARRYVAFLQARRPVGTSEQKFEAFLSHLARVEHVSATTQNQAFNALRFFYEFGLGQKLGDVSALRAVRRTTERLAPSVEQIRAMRSVIQDTPHTPARLLFDLLYGCGLRVSEPLELRIRDILWGESQLIIRDAKGAKDRRVNLPCSLIVPLRQQVERARLAWQHDRTHAPRVGVPLPHQLARKYPRAPFDWQWFWVFPAPAHCDHPRTGERVHYHLLPDALQRVVTRYARQIGVEGVVTPHCLRHAYATHLLARGASIKDVAASMGHVSIETTAGYCHENLARLGNPLDALQPTAPAPVVNFIAAA